MQANISSLSDAQIDQAARLFATLSEPSRLRLLQVLLRGPMTVTELVDATGMKQGNVSKQLGILYDAQVVARSRDGNFVRYTIADDTISQLCALVCGKLEKDALARVASFKSGPRPPGMRLRRGQQKLPRTCNENF